jgi:hypothetical protein
VGPPRPYYSIIGDRLAELGVGIESLVAKAAAPGLTFE